MEQTEFLDQIKQQVIIAILADDELGEHMVLKGGNLLRFAYQISARASKDVDISVDYEFEDVEWLAEKVRTCLEESFIEKDLVVFDFKFKEVPVRRESDDLNLFWGGYQCEFKLISKEKFGASDGNLKYIRRHAPKLDEDTGSTIFEIDFSRHEFCDDKMEFEIDGYTIYGYSPQMFAAEKLRAICQQMPEYRDVVQRGRPGKPRAKDFIDIHVIVEHYGVDFDSADFHKIVDQMFNKKKVPLDWIGKIKTVRDFHEPDFASVQATVHVGYDLQDYDFYFDFLCKQCTKLEPLWRK